MDNFAVDGPSNCIHSLWRRIGLIQNRVLKYYASEKGVSRNFHISALGLYTMCTILSIGTSGDTREEVVRFLKQNIKDCCNEEEDELDECTKMLKLLHDTYNAEEEEEDEKDSPTRTVFKSAMFLQEAPKAEYTKLLTEKLKCGSIHVDFCNKDIAEETIDSWTKALTRGLVVDFMKKSEALRSSQEILMVIVNIVYFSGRWKAEFDPNNSHISEFSITKLKTSQVTYMSKIGDFNYYSSSSSNNEVHFKMLSIPYKGDRYVGVFLLPNESQSLCEFIAEIDLNEKLSKLLSSNNPPIKVNVVIPKFSAQSSINFMSYLSEDIGKGGEGVRKLFDPNSCELSKMFDRTAFVSQLSQSITLKMDESGTEAAAVTSALISNTCIPDYEAEFEVTRPFFFILVDTHFKVPLFLSYISDPSQEYVVTS